MSKIISSNLNLPYHHPQDPASPLFQDLLWSLPEQKTGRLLIVGGHSQNFASTIKLTELATKQPLNSVTTLLPDAASKYLPKNLPNLIFTPSTPSGSFSPSSQLTSALTTADFNLIFGDLSKNSATTIALTEALKNTSTPTLLTRDAVDLLTPEALALIEKPELNLLLSLAQLQKLFRAVFYPKIILFSSPLPATIEILHKFTLSYPLTLTTLHQNQIITAHHGEVVTTPLSNTSFTTLSLWSGSLALNITCLSIWHPQNPLASTASTLFL